MLIFSTLSPEEELINEFHLHTTSLTGEVIGKALDDDGVSLYKVGEMYYNDRKDYEKALYWYRRSADKDIADAYFKLGCMYEYGQGVTRSRRTAMEWYLKAHGNKFWKGTHAVGVIHYKGSIFSFSRNFPEALRWFKIAAEKGHPPALYQVGLCYEKGHGVKKNKQEALEWYIRGDELGDMNARNARARLSAKGYCLNDSQERFLQAERDRKEEERRLKRERELQAMEALTKLADYITKVKRVHADALTNVTFDITQDNNINISFAN